MRRKSERTRKGKSSPEKKEDKKSKRGRPSRHRKHSSSSGAESSGGEASPASEVPEPMELPVVEAGVGEAPPEKPMTPSHEPLPGEESGPPVWQVKTDDSSGSGEIKKLKICLTRPPLTPERPDRSPRGRRKLDRTTSSIETPSESADEKRRGRHRTRRSTRHSRDSHGDEPDQVADKLELSDVTEENVPHDGVVTEIGRADEHPVSTTEEHPESTTEERPESTTDERPESTTDEQPEPIMVERQESITSEKPESTTEERPEVQETTTEIIASPILSGLVVEAKEVVSQEDTTVDNSNEESQPEEKNTENSNVSESTILPVTQHILEKRGTEEFKPANECNDELTSDVQSKESSKEIHNLPIPQSDPDDVFEGRRIEEEKENGNIGFKETTECKDNTKKETIESEVSHNHIRNSVSDDKINEATETTKTADELTLENYQANPIVVSRKRKWGIRVSKGKLQRPVSISTDILKDIIPDVKPVELEEVIKEKREEKQRKRTEHIEREKIERPVLPKIVIDNTEHVNNRRESERERKVNSVENAPTSHRKISIVKVDGFIARPPSPPKHKSSAILYITNLVRPFTLNQLKNLLQRTGRIAAEGFWIDRIKSKCYVKYESDDQAIETRHALHGVTWPVSNPKTLQVDFSTQQAMDKAKASEDENNAQKSAIPGTVEDWLREQDAKKERYAADADESKPWERKNMVREWDVGKGEKEKERLKRDDKPLEKRRHRSTERSPEPVRKFKKKEEEAPAKMLDDLFRKTKAVPCIYWLPLSAETIAIKEEQRRQHMAEHERRMQELARSRERPHRRH